MIHVNPNLDGQGPKRAVAFLGAFRSLRFKKKKIEKKSIFLANCILFDDKLQKVQNNLVLGDFWDDFWRNSKSKVHFFVQTQAIIADTVWSHVRKCVSYHGQGPLVGPQFPAIFRQQQKREGTARPKKSWPNNSKPKDSNLNCKF